MYWSIQNVVPLDGHRLWLEFEDGSRGIADLSHLRFEGVLEPLRDPSYFSRVRIAPGDKTISWPNGVDLDPLVLHSQVTGIPLPDFGAGPAPEAT